MGGGSGRRFEAGGAGGAPPPKRGGAAGVPESIGSGARPPPAQSVQPLPAAFGRPEPGGGRRVEGGAGGAERCRPPAAPRSSSVKPTQRRGGGHRRRRPGCASRRFNDRFGSPQVGHRLGRPPAPPSPPSDNHGRGGVGSQPPLCPPSFPPPSPPRPPPAAPPAFRCPPGSPRLREGFGTMGSPGGGVTALPPFGARRRDPPSSPPRPGAAAAGGGGGSGPLGAVGVGGSRIKAHPAPLPLPPPPPPGQCRIQLLGGEGGGLRLLFAPPSFTRSGSIATVGRPPPLGRLQATPHVRRHVGNAGGGTRKPLGVGRGSTPRRHHPLRVG